MPISEGVTNKSELQGGENLAEAVVSAKPGSLEQKDILQELFKERDRLVDELYKEVNGVHNNPNLAKKIGQAGYVVGQAVSKSSVLDSNSEPNSIRLEVEGRKYDIKIFENYGNWKSEKLPVCSIIVSDPEDEDSFVMVNFLRQHVGHSFELGKDECALKVVRSYRTGDGFREVTVRMGEITDATKNVYPDRFTVEERLNEHAFPATETTNLDGTNPIEITEGVISFLRKLE